MRKNHRLKVKLFVTGTKLQDLAAATGIPRGYISQAIHGRYVLDEQQKKRIADALDCSVVEIFDSDICNDESADESRASGI